MNKQQCIHAKLCLRLPRVAPGTKWNCETCSDYLPKSPNLLPVLRRLWLIYCERADRHSNHRITDFAVWWGKRLAIEQVILHFEKQQGKGEEE